MSSTPNKRPHEEGGNGGGGHGHSSASKYQHEDSGVFPGIGAKIPSSTQNEYHASYDMGQDSRMPKVPRTESRDPDRRSPLLPSFRVSSSSNDSHADHPAGFESRLEFRDSKDSNREPKFESRDTKVESRDLYQANKVEKDVKFESRADDSKETKYERDSYPEHRGDLKIDKDGYGGVSIHSNWKDSKEQHRGKRYPDASGGSMDPWHNSRSNLHVPSEGGKEASIVEEKDYSEAREAVGENKLDMKGEDKFKDRDRKRKEGKHREWGERDRDRSDRRIPLQIGSNSNAENKDPVKEEREADRWEKDRKDFSRDKDKVNYRGEKDHTKKESGSGAEKESSCIDKEMVDVPGRAAEPDNPNLELKKLKENDGWKNADRDQRDKRKERDADLEGEKLDKRNKHNDKESDEGCGDAEGGTEREREGFSYGVQQRKRMLRPRGSPQLSNRDPRFRPRNHENEGKNTVDGNLKDEIDLSSGTGKPDMSTVIYRVGECMQDLIRLWKDYEASQVDKTAESSQNGPTLEIRIPAEHVSATNRQVRGGQLWGTDIYTDDSDLVAVLMHTGYCRPTASPPPATIQELRATIRVLPPQDCYISTLRNNVRSRAWGAAIGCSYRVERCCIVKKGGGTIDLEPCLTHSSTLEPTLAPVAVERTMTTRAAASNALRQQRFVREVTIQFNLCNEPWLKYSISAIADKGLKKPLYTSSRLKKGEVLYLETHSRRYELSFSGEKMVKAGVTSQALEAENERTQTHSSHPSNGDRGAVDGDTVVIDVFRWSRCKKPLPQKLMRTIGIPLPLEHVEVVEDNLEWEDIRWSSTGVWIAGKEYPLARAHFLSLN